jgi:hypothetical protein
VARLPIDALGSSVELVGSSAPLQAIERDWSRCAALAEGPATATIQVADADPPETASTAALASRITMAGIEGSAGRRLLFHACGLSLDDGRVVVLVGPSGAGKSTASAALCRERFGYVSDETVAIAPDFTISAYPKPLLVRTRKVLPKQVVGPDEMGLLTCPDALQASRLVLLRRDGTSPPRLDPVPMVEGILGLIPETSALARLATPLSDLCRLVDHCGGVHVLRYAEAADTEHLLTALVDGPLVGTDTWQPVSAGAASASAQAEGWLVAPEVQEAVCVEDEVLLLHEGRPVRLSGIGATLWWESRSGATDASLLDAAVQQHGPHPDAQRIVEAAISELTRRGVIHRLGP